MADFSQKQRKISERSLANLKPYKPGQSGNPGGRPKGEKLSSILLRVLEEPDRRGGKQTKGERFIRNLLKYANRGRAGDGAYAKQVLDRADGAVDGGDVTVRVVFVKSTDHADDAGSQN